jgi:hypothetical protein
MIFPTDGGSAPVQSTTSWWNVETPPTILAFLERLRRLPLGDWAAAADRTAPGIDRTYLRTVIESSPDLASRARGKIDHFLGAAEGLVSPPALRAMRKAALTAVLALAARARLEPLEFETLYGPFADLIPPDSLLPEESWQAG